MQEWGKQGAESSELLKGAGGRRQEAGRTSGEEKISNGVPFLPPAACLLSPVVLTAFCSLLSALSSPPSPRLLLREAVQGSQSPDEVYGVDAGDFAVGEELGEYREGDAVFGVVEGGDQD